MYYAYPSRKSNKTDCLCDTLNISIVLIHYGDISFILRDDIINVTSEPSERGTFMISFRER